MEDPSSLLSKFNESEEAPPVKSEAMSNEHRFHIDFKDHRGVRYKGDFVSKMPNIGDQITIGRLKTAYLPNGAPADPNSTLYNEMVCYLEVCLKERPSWWKPLEFTDELLLAKVYEEVRSYERKFRGEDTDDQRSKEEASESTGEKGSSELVDSADVGRKARSADERSEVIVSHRS